MKKYIDKDALVAEIEKRYEYWREKEFNSHSIESEIRMSECQHLMLLFNTIETKEVDLDNELDFVKDAYYYFTSDERSNMKKVARHFFELGLRTQKG